jgi:hypothetical protein
MRNTGIAKNIILFIGDGMSIPTGKLKGWDEYDPQLNSRDGVSMHKGELKGWDEYTHR